MLGLGLMWALALLPEVSPSAGAVEAATRQPIDAPLEIAWPVTEEHVGGDAPPTPPEVSAAVISGRVTNIKTGEPVDQALVILMCTCLAGQREMLTDSKGLYRFRGLPPGKYTVQVLWQNANVNKSMQVAEGVKFRANYSIDPRPIICHYPHYFPVQRRIDRSLLADGCPQSGAPQCLRTTREPVRVTHMR